jgi:hypothetical protein
VVGRRPTGGRDGRADRPQHPIGRGRETDGQITEYRVELKIIFEYEPG